MKEAWYCVRGGTPHGPMPLVTLRGLVDSGELSASDLVWHNGFTEWVRARLIEELFPRLNRTAIPPLPIVAVAEDKLAAPLEGHLSAELRAKAEHNHLQATFKLHECQSHLRVFDTRRELAETARDGLEFIDAALGIDPESSRYWNLKGLLLSDGLHEGGKALECFRRALELEPDSIVIRQNIRNTEDRM